MKVLMKACRPGQVLTLKARRGVSAEELLELLELLVTDGIEISVGPIEGGQVGLAIRKPKLLRAIGAIAEKT